MDFIAVDFTADAASNQTRRINVAFDKWGIPALSQTSDRCSQNCLRHLQLRYDSTRWSTAKDNTIQCSFVSMETSQPLHRIIRRTVEKYGTPPLCFFKWWKKNEPKKRSHIMCNLSRFLWQKLKQKNQQLKQIMDQLRNLIWEINSMLAIRSWARARVYKPAHSHPEEIWTHEEAADMLRWHFISWRKVDRWRWHGVTPPRDENGQPKKKQAQWWYVALSRNSTFQIGIDFKFYSTRFFFLNRNTCNVFNPPIVCD